MACLTYKPGRVQYLGEELSRDYLLNMKDGVIQRLGQYKDETGVLIQNLVQLVKSEEKIDKKSEKGQVMYYDSRLSQNDIDLIAIMEKKKSLFPDAKPLSQKSPLNILNKVLSDDTVLKDDFLSFANETGSALDMAQKTLKNQIRSQSRQQSFAENTQSRDKYNNEDEDLINMEIRDQADQIYHDN